MEKMKKDWRWRKDEILCEIEETCSGRSTEAKTDGSIRAAGRKAGRGTYRGRKENSSKNISQNTGDTAGRTKGIGRASERDGRMRETVF